MSKYSVHVRDKYEYDSVLDNDIYNKVVEEVEAESVCVNDGALCFYKDKKMVKAFNRDNWLAFDKIF